MTWSSAGAPGIHVVRGEGVYFWDASGKRYMDFNSMAMCSHHGHTVDPSIIEAINHQLKTIPYAYPGVFITGVRGKLSKLLADICPGDIDTFLFPSSGTEAIEGAIRLARRYTGRHKIMSRCCHMCFGRGFGVGWRRVGSASVVERMHVKTVKHVVEIFGDPTCT